MSNKIKKGQLYKSINSSVIIKIVNKSSGNKHWNTKRINGKKNHKIHEGSLLKFYKLIK
jgi:hypothetical protein